MTAMARLLTSVAIGSIAIGCNSGSTGPSLPGPVARVVISFDPASKQIRVGDVLFVDTIAYDARGLFTFGNSISLVSSDPTIIRLDPGSGAAHMVAHAIVPGKAIITATQDGISAQDTLTVSP
jgi:hypothetical protein